MRVCLESNCPVLTNKSRCDRHTRERDRARGTRQERGYGAEHQAERKRWAPFVALGLVQCWRCGGLIASNAPWDLGHDDLDRSKYRGPEHVGRECKAGGNRATSGRRDG